MRGYRVIAMASPVTNPPSEQTVSPRMIVPLLMPEAHAAFAVTAPAAHLSYHHGPLLQAVEVVTVFWGPEWQQPAQSLLIPRLNQFFDFILTSALMDVLAEYGVPGHPIGHGHRSGTVSVPTPAPNPITDAQIQQQLQAWIQNHTLPQPNANTLYFVYLPPGVVSILGGERSCVKFCGYHSHSGGSIFYAVEPFITCGGCTFGHGVFDSLTKVSSHELCEAITDPALNGWFDNNGGDEIGDICNAGVATLGGFVIQTEWSNLAKACVSIPRGDHFYTTSQVEHDNAVQHLGYTDQGQACFVSATHIAGTVPFHRLRKHSTGEHFYTMNDAERDSAIQHLGFTSEGEACFVNASQVAGTTPLHRLLQPTTGQRFYTISDAERNNAVANLGYQNEGEACFVFANNPSGKLPLLRVYKTL